MSTNLDHLNDSDTPTQGQSIYGTLASTINQGLLAGHDTVSQPFRQEVEDAVRLAALPPPETLVQGEGDQSANLTFPDYGQLGSSDGLQVDPSLTTTNATTSNNNSGQRDHNYFPRAGVTGVYASMARNERILSNLMLSPNQSRLKQQFSQTPTTASLSLPMSPRGMIYLTLPSPENSSLLARRRAIVTTKAEAPSVTSNSSAALLESSSSGFLPRPPTLFPIAATTSRNDAIGGSESGSYFPTVSVGASLTLSDPMVTSPPCPPPRPTSSLPAAKPLRVAQFGGSGLFPQPALRLDNPHRPRRLNLLSCVLLAVGDQEHVSASSSNGGQSDSESEEDLELEYSGDISYQLIPLSPGSCCFKADNTPPHPAVSELDLLGSKVILDLIDTTGTSGSAVSSPNMAQGSFDADMSPNSNLVVPVIDKLSNIPAASTSVSTPEGWSTAELTNLTVNFPHGIQSTALPSNVFLPQSPHTNTFSPAVPNSQPQMAPSDQNSQVTLSVFNTTPRSSIPSSRSKREVESVKTLIEVPLLIPESQFTLAGQEQPIDIQERAEGRHGSEYSASFADNQPGRSNTTSGCSGGEVVPVGIAIDTGSILQSPSGHSGAYCTFRSMIKDEGRKKEEKEEKEEEEDEEDKEEETGRRSVIPWLCFKTLRSDFDIIKFTAAYHVAINLSVEYEKFSRRYQQQRLHPSNRDQPPDQNVVQEKNTLTSPLKGLLEKKQPRDEWILQCGGAHKNLSVCVPEASSNGSHATESSDPVVDDEWDDFFEVSIQDLDNSCDTGEGGAVSAKDNECSQHPYRTHKFFESHPHLRDLYPPMVPKLIKRPGRPSYILGKEGQKLSLTPNAALPHPSTWSFQLGPHFTPVVNNALTVTCENCLRQFKMSAPDRLDVLDRHQAEYCRTPKQQKWQQRFLVAEKMFGHGVAFLVDEGDLGRDSGRLVVEKDEDGVVRGLLHGCESWYSTRRNYDPLEEEEDVFFDAAESVEYCDEEEDEEMDEIEFYRWL
ncbi:hypothetical protein BGZ96_004302 [Linnemannia gamsii]|uniref:Uncharacterized protein n=1 Tax=Linnemannia gamsii TaxID=64522 RepID=A0ABQ7K7C7_9FUNG|nr:hypothetical protein BGZ96_004302 [Linnemannia gamsii]